MSDPLDLLKKQWKNNDCDEQLTSLRVTEALDNHSKGINTNITNTLKACFFLIVIDVLSLFSLLFSFSSNTSLIFIIITAIVVCLLSLINLRKQNKKWKNLIQDETSIYESLKIKIEFITGSYQTVFYSYGLGVALIPFCINLFQVRHDGYYSFIKPEILIMFYVFSFILSFILIKGTHTLYLNELKIAYEALKEDSFDDFERVKRRNKRILLAVGLVLFISVILGILLYVKI
jgi:hypothetical protein